MVVGTWAVLSDSGSSPAVDSSQYLDAEFALLGLPCGDAHLRLHGLLADRLLVCTACSLTASAAEVAIALQFALVIDVSLGGHAFEEDDTHRRGVGAALVVAGVGVAV